MFTTCFIKWSLLFILSYDDYWQVAMLSKDDDYERLSYLLENGDDAEWLIVWESLILEMICYNLLINYFLSHLES